MIETDFERRGTGILALATFELSSRVTLIDLDDPRQFNVRELKPSRVATFDRRMTQQMAAAIYNEGAAGFLWWSTLESLWINCTLFSERASPGLQLVEEPSALQLDNPHVIAAAERIGVTLG